MSAYESNPAIKNLRTYLRIRSEHPNINYDECINFLKSQAKELDLPYKIYEVYPKNPIFIMTWKGEQPELPAILLNSHMDVVPVFEKSWTHPPFEAHMDEDGTIYARGVQDMKSVAIQYIETVRKLKNSGFKPKRTIHLSFVPDEELGGTLGMEKFVSTEDFKNLNLGFSLDEGFTSSTQDYYLFYAERAIWHIHVHCPGTSGHGSLLHENTAAEKIRYVIDKFLDLREEQKRKLASNKDLTIGDVTTINLTRLSGGIQTNVVPEELVASFDIRLDLNVDHKEFEERINNWFKEAGKDVSVEFEQKQPYVPPTKLDDSNPFWVAFKSATEEIKKIDKDFIVKPRVFPGGTDSRYIRALGIPCIGFSPIVNTPVQLHQHNESLKADVFLHGITIYEKIIPALANV